MLTVGMHALFAGEATVVSYNNHPLAKLLAAMPDDAPGKSMIPIMPKDLWEAGVIAGITSDNRMVAGFKVRVWIHSASSVAGAKTYVDSFISRWGDSNKFIGYVRLGRDPDEFTVLTVELTAVSEVAPQVVITELNKEISIP
jgi:hypothetical protein